MTHEADGNEKPLTISDYNAALKKANAKGKNEQFLALEFQVHSGKLVLPYKKGVELMGVLQDALLCREYWSDVPVIQEITEEIVARPVSQDYLDDMKVGKLLGIPYNQAKTLRESSQ